jgi:hypothetical protein
MTSQWNFDRAQGRFFSTGRQQFAAQSRATRVAEQFVELRDSNFKLKVLDRCHIEPVVACCDVDFDGYIEDQCFRHFFGDDDRLF